MTIWNGEPLIRKGYTRSRLPVKLVYNETCANRSEAYKREYQIKQLTRSQKKQLVETCQ